MFDASVLERVKVLQFQVARIQAANQAFLDKPSHARLETEAQEKREQRLHDIMGELIHLARKMKAA